MRNRRTLLRLRVAERLGFNSIADMIEEIGDAQVDQWCALALLDGWGEEWTRTAHVVAKVHNASLVGKVGEDGDSLLLDPWDCRPRFKWERKPAREDETEQQSDQFLEMLGKRMAGFNG